jgi:hypothetical protein
MHLSASLPPSRTHASLLLAGSVKTKKCDMLICLCVHITHMLFALIRRECSAGSHVKEYGLGMSVLQKQQPHGNLQEMITSNARAAGRKN